MVKKVSNLIYWHYMDDLKQKIIPVLEKYGVKKAALFGSYSRGEHTEKSDVDLLINMVAVPSFFELARLQSELELLFGKKVDLVMEENLKKSLAPFITPDLITLYEKN